ncbi:MAG: SpoIIE family protein phosphatase [Gemmatimonadota bacterium]
MTPPRRDGAPFIGEALPEPVIEVIQGFEASLHVGVRLVAVPREPGGATEVFYESANVAGAGSIPSARATVSDRQGRTLILEILHSALAPADVVCPLLGSSVERAFASSREIEYFTEELTERYEEINLLYTISETLGSVVHMDDAARAILREICDNMGAKQGSLWLFSPETEGLALTAVVGKDGHREAGRADQADPVISMVFRDQQAVIASRAPSREERARGQRGDSFIAVPIRYTPPSGEARTLGVMELIARRGEESYSVADQKLLTAIAFHMGSALENKRLHDESLAQERMGREMELAHDLQQKLLPDAGRFAGAEAAARVSPAEQVGGDFYQLFQLSRGRVGVMLGDVSLHGFPSALIMTLTMSAAGIYAREHDSPARVLRDLDDALREELETTEMFLTVFYGVIDPGEGTLVYSNAGHPHAFLVHEDGRCVRLAATDPPVGFAGPDSYGETPVSWVPGSDLLLLFTDGLSDTLSSSSRGDGEQRILKTVAHYRQRPASTILEELFRLTTGAEPPVLGDDRTALVVRTP